MSRPKRSRADLRAGRPRNFRWCRVQNCRRATRKGRTVWVTRSRPKIDRIACPWLIRRFVDPTRCSCSWRRPRCVAVGERFGAAPFDIENVFWSHRGELCTFDVMIEEFGLATPPLLRLATIVRGADTARLDLAPEAPGLLAASLGLSRMYRRRSRAARGRHAVVRCLLSLVPRRDRRNPQLAVQQGEAVNGATMTDDRSGARRDAGHGISFGEAFRVWLRVALLSLRRPGGPDRGDASHPGRGEELDFRKPFSACAELLHAAAGPGGAAACDLYRLADAPDRRRHHGRRPVHPARHHRHHGLELHLRRLSAMSASSRRCSSG